MSTASCFSREMGVTHREFFRGLPAAIGHRRFRAEGNRVHVELGGASLVITLGPERVRRIAALRLPCTMVGFEFYGVETSDRRAFMQRFDLCFRRGGG